jgi:O-glycosyl hydrolase
LHAGFSRYIRPGAVFVEVDHPDIVAAVSADEQSLTLVVRNGDAAASRGFTFDLTALPAVGSATEAWRTSRTEDLVPLSPIAIEGYAFVAEVPAYSVTTFFVPIPAG